jgi:hypothetical protein
MAALEALLLAVNRASDCQHPCLSFMGPRIYKPWLEGH